MQAQPPLPGLFSLICFFSFFKVEVVAVENGVATGGFWFPGGEFNSSCVTSYSSLEDADGSSSFHVFAVEWTEDRFR